jgi:tetratricopeptide (TPR) repeat protein
MKALKTFVVGAVLLCAACDDEPTAEHQTKAEKYKEVVGVFTGEVSSDGGEHAEGIRNFFDRLRTAAITGDEKKTADQFDMKMTFRVLEQNDLLPAGAASNKKNIIAALETGMGRQLTDPLAGMQWKRMEVRGVRFIQDETEALVFARHWDEDDVSSKMRWWLYRKDDVWRAYDYESLDLSVRFSTMLGIGFKAADQKDRSVARVKEMMDALRLLNVGEFAEALEIMQNLEDAKLPPALESLRLLFVASLLAEEGEYEEALNAADRASAINSDMPLLHLLYADCRSGIGEYRQALQDADKYAKLLGQDADYYEAAGIAHLGMGDAEKAIEAHKKGLVDDAQVGGNVLGLFLALPPEKRASTIGNYRRLNDVEEWFIAFADQLLVDEDAPALRALIEMHRKVSPDDENIEFYEEELEAMEQDDP